ncbi:Protein prenyltransferase alpha subunit repeat-containing protein 1 [Rhynchospora pubera]|uniref:Protein prenyltransferase alpha subunit repeat-containing protein 1 n=1 Tax=Rhynchospora pubera TaxID=906938 RepID=A0AAV8FWP2_9POAL|nr:Protein prenyltransferase alpha subunit repeat-containing protein 1 [Rhynchospora pubera]
MEGCDDLLLQLEQILENDELIDEIGFIHPTQFSTLDTSFDSHSVQFNTQFFWNKDHKLAISFEILSSLYRAAIQKHSCARRNYKTILSSCSEESSELLDSEKDLLRHSKALAILSPNFHTAWNSRKLVLSKHNDVILFLNELRLSTLILSYAPKSECAWSHRRWIIKLIAERFQILEGIIRNESELVKKICEKFKMNYRAWNHWCWLVSYMTTQQVLDELGTSRKWAEQHIADNSCFQFRRCLLVRALKTSSETDKAASYNEKSEFCAILEGELKWNDVLIRRYVGREALWMHRRFLSHCWIRKFANDLVNLFLDQEMQLVKTYLVASPDEFDDTLVQAYLAAAYFLWLSKLQTSPHIGNEIHNKLREAGDLISLLVKISPEKDLFWRSIGI